MKKMFLYFGSLGLEVIDLIFGILYTITIPIILLLPTKLYEDYCELICKWKKPLYDKLFDLEWELKKG